MSPIASGVGIAVGWGSLPSSGGGGPSYPAHQILALDANNVSGSTWTDLTGNGNDFTLVGSPAFNGDVGGGALEFEGTNVYAEIASGLGKFDSQEISINIWWYYTVLEANQGLWSYDFTSHSSPTYYAQHIRAQGNNMGNYWNNNGTWGGLGFTSSGAAVVGEWMLWTLVIKSGESRVFKNGVQQGGTDSRTFTVTFYDQEVWIGRLNYDSTSNIKVAKVDVFDEAQTPTAVSDYYDTHKARFGLT
jgi:hypothetical protein